MDAHSNISLVVGFPKRAPSPRQLGALHRKFQIHQEEKLDLINGYSIQVPEDKVDRYVAALPKSATVMVDRELFGEPAEHEDLRDTFPEFDDIEQDAPRVSRPKGLSELHARGITGKGTTIAVVDSGLSKHRDFSGRVKYFRDFSAGHSKTRIDPFGHGTHVAGIVAGDGEEIDGIAPEAELVGLRITSPKQAIKAIEWAVKNKEKYDIDVLNLSLGVKEVYPNRQDPFAQAAQQAIDAGIITVVAAGNECTSTHCSGTISTPGTLKDAITVGAYSDGGTVDFLGDDKIWARSSNGPTLRDKHAKPDLVAPGVNVLAPRSAGSDLGKRRPQWKKYHYDTGSSMATPMVSGTAALLLQVDPNLGQEEIREILTGTADPLEGSDRQAQGAGRLDLWEALEEAGADLSAPVPRPEPHQGEVSDAPQ